MGNANELLSQARRCNTLQCIDESLEKYGKELRFNSREYLFGKEFCSQLKSKVESDTTFHRSFLFRNAFTLTVSDPVTLAKPLWGVASNSFFEETLPEKLGFGRANRPPAGSNTEKPKLSSTTRKNTRPPIFRGSPRGNPREILLPHSTFMDLQL